MDYLIFINNGILYFYVIDTTDYIIEENINDITYRIFNNRIFFFFKENSTIGDINGYLITDLLNTDRISYTETTLTAYLLDQNIFITEYPFHTIYNIQNIPTGTTNNIYIDASKHNFGSIGITCGTATDQITVIVYASFQNPSIDINLRTYHNIMQLYTKTDGFVNESGVVVMDTINSATSYRVTYITTNNGGNDQSIQIDIGLTNKR